MNDNKPSIFGIKYSNRNFNNPETWGKNQFNSSFPAGLANYLQIKGLKNIYIKLNNDFNVVFDLISTDELYGIDSKSEDLYFAFESVYSPYQKFLIGDVPRVDLVLQQKQHGACLRPLEIKLTALPDNSTCALSEEAYGCELVIRPDTIVYLACSIVQSYEHNRAFLLKTLNDFSPLITDWSDGQQVWPHLSKIILNIKKIVLNNLGKQEPIMMQPIWKTVGKSSQLAEHCLDVFVWSNFAFTNLFLNVALGEVKTETKITRQIRTIIWLYKMLLDYAQHGFFDHKYIIDQLSYNTKNDKAFAVGGRITRKYMDASILLKPRISKTEIKKIILGDGQNLLSPERRFDAIIHNSPDLFV